MTLRNVVGTGVLLLSGLAAGCGHAGYGVAVGPPPPMPVYGPAGVAPSPDYIWNDGHYDLRGNNWFWMGGQWARRPYPGALWQAPRWEVRRHGYRFHQGRWHHGHRR